MLVRLPQTGAVLLTIDAVPFAAGFTRDKQDVRVKQRLKLVESNVLSFGSMALVFQPDNK